MPETNTVVSRFTPICASARCTVARIRVVTATRAPAHVLIGFEVLLAELDRLLRSSLTKAPPACSDHCPRPAASPANRELLDRRDHLADLERLPLDLVEPDRIDQIAIAHDVAELAHVELRDQHVPEALDDLVERRLERVQPAQVVVADLLALRTQHVGRLAERAERAAPAEHEHVAGALAAQIGRADLLRDARDLLGAHLRLLLVVGGVVRDVAGERVLLDAADAVLETGRAGDDPLARERLVVARYTK